MGRLTADRASTRSAFYECLWALFVVISFVLMVWPVSPSPTDPLPVQSVYAIQDLSWFIIVFYGWAIVFGSLLLLFKGDPWERLALCLVFTLVFVQFWGPITNPWGNSGDSAWLMAHVKRLQEAGEIPLGGHSTLTYFDFPGIQLVLLILDHVTALELFQVSRVYLIAAAVVLVTIMNAAFLKLLRVPYEAALAVALAVISSRVLSAVPNQFHPINLATIYIAAFVLMLARDDLNRFGELESLLVLTILTMAATIEYMFTPVFFSVVLLADYLLHRPSKTFGERSLFSAVFPLVMFFSWEAYLTVHNFPSTVKELAGSVQGLMERVWLIPAQRVLRANLGGSYPWWGSMAKLFWWLSTFGLGTFLMIWRFLHFRKVDKLKSTQQALFTGIVATVVLGSLVGGAIGVIHGGLSRYVWVAPFVLAPALVQVLVKPSARTFRLAFVLPALLLLPATFMTNGDTFSSSRVYRHEVAVMEFISSRYPRGTSVTLYSFPSILAVGFLFIPDARFVAGAYLYGGATEAEAWSGLRNAVQAFRSNTLAETSLAIESIKARKDYELRLGVSPGHPNWLWLTGELSKTNRIYDVGTAALYTHRRT